MSGKQSGVQNYVQSKNVMPEGARKQPTLERNPSFDDLKVSTKASAAVNNHQQRSNSRPDKHFAPAQTDTRIYNNEQGGRGSNGQGAFYDTDASSIGDTSTTVSARRSNEILRPQQRQVVNAGADEQQRTSSQGGSGSGSIESEDLPFDPLAPQLKI